jgi:hypothetical protein
MKIQVDTHTDRSGSFVMVLSGNSKELAEYFVYKTPDETLWNRQKN